MESLLTGLADAEIDVRHEGASATPAGTMRVHAIADVLQASDTLTATVSLGFPAEWETERQEVIGRLRDLPHALQDAERALRWLEEARPPGVERFGIGGNQPQGEPNQIASETELAAGTLLEVLGLNRVLPVTIRYAVQGLKRVIGLIAAGVACGAMGFVEGVGKKIGEDDAESIRHHLVDLEAKLGPIVTHIEHLFTLLK